jgi:hypothetical protein
MCGRSRGGEEVSWREEGKSKINKEKLKRDIIEILLFLTTTRSYF